MRRMQTRPDAPEPLFNFDAFIDLCARMIARGVDYASLHAAVVGALDEILPAPAQGALREDPELRRSLAVCMARAVWKEMPHPAYGFAPAPLRSPERNERCHCGSGRKYKVCCLEIERHVPLEDVDYLPALLDHLPRARWEELAGSRISVDLVAHTAREWLEKGDATRVMALLEPWFAADDQFHFRREQLFDLLLDAYTESGRARRKVQLIDRAIAVGDRTLRSAAMQRRVTMLSDAGDYDAAWALFREAQRHEPDSPHLSHLEVTVLLSQGREAEARARAKFWLLRLGSRRDPAFEHIIELLQDVASDGSLALAQMALDHDPVLAELAALFKSAPPIACQYSLQAQADEAGPMTPKPALRKALAAWDQVCERADLGPLASLAEHSLLDSAARWLPVLRAQPQLWNSFEVLQQIAGADAFHQIGLREALQLPLLDRAEQLLRHVLRANDVGQSRLEWGWRENRPALWLIGQLAAMELDGAATAAHVARLEWLVLTLNPDDNQGFRQHLVRRWLEAGRMADAIALCERQVEDFAPMRYNHALALFAADRRDEALLALRAAFDEYPKPLAWLLKANPKAPKPSQWGIQVGGDDEAYEYRCDMLPLWQHFGALDWARAAARAFKAR